MANQIKKKYIENDAIDGLKILLEDGQTLRKKDGAGGEVDVIANIESQISDEETRALEAESGLDARITAVENQVGEDLQAAISQLESDISDEATARQSADSNLQNQITSIQGAGDTLFEDDASVYADATAGIEDPNGRDGWYYKSAGSPEKVNWYFFDGSQTQVTVGQLESLYTVATVDSASTDTFHLAYYTIPLGDGNDAGSWYRSRQVFVPVEPFQRGEKALFWVKNQPDASVYPNLPRVQMQPTTVAGSSVGLNADSELLLTTVFGTNSAADANSIELVANKLGIFSSVYNKEYSLEIRGEFTLAGIKESLLEESILREQADANLQDQIDANKSDAESKIETEKARIDAILSASDADKDSFAEIVSLINSVDTENDTAFANYVLSNNARVDALEGKGFAKGSVVIGSELAYIDLDREYETILSMSVGRLAIHEDEDYTVSVVGGVTRITWINSLANPSGEEKIETGDKIFYSGAF